jgi:hypothetical protein
MNIRKTVEPLERFSKARQHVVMPRQGNMLSGADTLSIVGTRCGVRHEY